MAKPINPPQFDEGDVEETRLYKTRQFVEDVIRSFDELNDQVSSGGGGSSSGGGYPAQLGYAGIL